MRLTLILVVLLFSQITCAQDGTRIYKHLNDTSFHSGDIVELPQLAYHLSGGHGVIGEHIDSLDLIFDFLKRNSELDVKITCHTDQRGSEMMNTNISDQRAKWVMQYLITKGLDEKRLSYKGLGESEPRVTQKTIDNALSDEEKEYLYSLNRRTEIIIQ